MNKLNIVILAAGKGTRMYSTLPKVLHVVGAKTILAHVIDCAKTLNPNKIIVVYGFGGEMVKEAFANENITWVKQEEQLGTGHAVQQAVPFLEDDADTLILLGDVPLVDSSACRKLLEQANNKLAILSFNKDDPTGYGRIVRELTGNVAAIVEHKDATVVQRQINEVNTGIMAMPNKYLVTWLSALTNHNAQGEYYLTDIVELAVNDKVNVVAEITADEWSVTGINSKTDLAQIERVYQLRNAQKLLQQGVTIKDPARLDVRGLLNCGRDVEIDVNCVFEGNVSLGDNVKISANCIIKNAIIEAGVQIAPFTHIDDTKIGENSRIGPFARLRPGTTLAADTHVGNFVELKNSQVDVGSKINHLSYVGDTTVGKNVNIGAGTITCNYDGANKFRTIIEDNAFIGSDSQLVAPVTIGRGATIAAGSTITRDAPADALTFCRAKDQKTIVGWKRPQKIKK
ncbi:bifunctional UDP-N-acetylglucosamine diphosphorylase/glucosamine-1-phosphate N-acetyltransferase GlmU [Methylotenera sp.]|uniref:bifunctional UDP-N-acetylglucosamine diphosphorylase/glucosamine-1-phosphate N-acetyltransferase GlmU n=1 Tax=Methylotenera sp. TaxID=2051956 RepID=UPI002722CA01|nr:bifunctional UDP-N-acetylglucosamine diphosphorylase/glucosamine-1-phosphate N-acetyltransferase GlmU [Methylotenera sp.]MDO9203921.1 bifunctional UDP-N-acetylglucosamine diphosphorylase/glucosamine-1-phosphate N-acetyltransferase GlmU [Methylotenera sp.]MDP1522450.1 bifunctional UDP-N-acetylglucosamine diphosphorylase/glucosamine-1-phosphate N-acetyltransferase GlmU [Methylotenera sp.]MDP2229491.1 bifunctional UDP-N-acetylglucosamine diphosphorylase/glucosamine-1-phosphate N-acetyltransferas